MSFNHQIEANNKYVCIYLVYNVLKNTFSIWLRVNYLPDGRLVHLTGVSYVCRIIRLKTVELHEHELVRDDRSSYLNN